MNFTGTEAHTATGAEGLARSVPNFSRFLETAAAMNGEILNYTKLGNNAQLSPRTPEHGRVLEHLIERELRASIDYLKNDRHLFFWRSLSRLEVDFVLAEGQKPVVAIEVKASRSVSQQDLKGLRTFAEDWPRVRTVVVSLESHPRTTEDGVEIMPLEDFLARLWDRAT